VHVRSVCIALFILSYRTHALHSVWGTVYFIPIFSLVVLRNICRYSLLGMTVEARRAAAFLSLYFLNLSPWGQVWFTLHAGIRRHFLFHKHVFVVFLFIVFQQKKKKFGENLQEVISLGLLDIACILAWYLNSVCIDSICLDIIENFDYIGQSVFPVYAKVG
jgi:hypothetical protein